MVDLNIKISPKIPISFQEMENPDLQAKRQESGATGPPEVFLLEHEFDE